MHSKANAALSKAKLDLMGADNAVFFSVVMLSLHHLFDDSQPTAYTDGRVVGYNTQFFMDLSREERVGILLHETLHVAFLHPVRAMGYDDQRRANEAMDYVINLIIRDAGFKLPSIALYNPKYRGMSWEQVYNLLPPTPPSPPFGIVDLRQPPTDTVEELKDIIDDILVQAAIQSRMKGDKPGSIPGDLARYVDALINPEVPWEKILRSMLNKFARDDYSYRRPNRRIKSKFIIPGLFSEKICDIAIGDDVSGSVTQLQHNHFAAETNYILKKLKPEKVTFLQFDTRITQVDVLKGPKDMDRVRFKGGGGTDIEPLMQWAQQNKPACLIVFSDGEYRPPVTNPKVPIFWIINGNPNFTAPFGKVIPYNFTGPRSS